MKTTITALKIVACVFGGLGVLMAAIGIILYYNTTSFIDNAGETVAQITQVDYDYDDDNVYYVTYVALSIPFRNVRLNSSSSSWERGDYIDIYYALNNPSEIRSKDLAFVPTLVTGILGGVFLLVALIVFVVMRKKRDNYDYLTNYGLRYQARITEIKRNEFVYVNGHNTFNIVCVCVDDENMVFESPSTLNPSAYAVGDIVTVYVDRNDENNYLIDLGDKASPDNAILR